QLGRQAGLARPARADQRDKPRSVEEFAEPFQELLTPDEGGRLSAQVGRGEGGRRALETRVSPEYGDMEALQLWRGVGAELLSEESARLVVRNQGVGLAAGGVERAHVQAPNTLVQRVGGDQCFQLRNQTGVRAAGELRLDPVAGRVQPELLEAKHLGAQNVGPSEVP